MFFIIVWLEVIVIDGCGVLVWGVLNVWWFCIVGVVILLFVVVFCWFWLFVWLFVLEDDIINEFYRDRD